MQSNHSFPLTAAAVGAALLLGSSAASASVYGTLSNFDVFNNSTGNYYGFEFEMEGVSTSQVAWNGANFYTFPSQHYGSGRVTTTATGVLVRYFNDSNPNAFTVPFTAAITPTTGHSCVALSGCEHFGIALNVSPTKTSYYWLDQTGARAQQVNMLMPTFTVAQPANPAQNQPAVVRVEVEAPEVRPGQLRSDAIWVKVFKRELEGPVDLEDLMADNAAVPDVDNNDGQGEVEIEWKLFQRDPSKPDQNILDNGKDGEEIPDGNHQVLRTYTIYEFAGTYDASHEAICTEIGNCEDLAASGDHLPYVGRLIGQQMGALNLDGALPAPVPVPAGIWLLGSGLIGLVVSSRRRLASRASHG